MTQSTAVIPSTQLAGINDSSEPTSVTTNPAAIELNPAINSSNQVVSLNVPTISALPMAMPVTAINNLPITVCALNTQQTIPSSTTLQSVPTVHSVQTNPIGAGGIIVLNVGGAGNNGLAAAISQLVAGAGLVQQQQAIQTVIPATQVTPSSANQMSAPQGYIPANHTLSTTPQLITSNQVQPTNIQMNGVQNISPMNYHPMMALQTNMGLGSQAQAVIPQQSQQQAQAAPTAFMLVPIPQVAAVQSTTCGINQSQACVNVNQQQQPIQVQHQPQVQQHVMVNLQNQVMASVPNQIQMQQLNSANVSIMPPPGAGNHQVTGQQMASMLQQTLIQPRNQELKAFLTKPSCASTSVTSTVTQMTSVMSPMYSLSQPQQTFPSTVQASTHSNLTNQLMAPHFSIMSPQQSISLPSQTNLPVSRSPPRYSQQAAVSSPGLAFLAQVSSLSSNQYPTTSTVSNPIPTASPTMSVASNILGALSFTHGSIFKTEEVNNNTVPKSSESVKQHDFLGEISSFTTTTTPVDSTTVSSTTKLGDESESEVIIEEAAEQHCTETLIPEIEEAESLVEDSSFQFQANSTVVSVCTKTGREKRKKGPAPKLNGNELCLICGDRASGFHYNVLSCEGCKGFFRRSIIKGARYLCKNNGDCNIDLYMRRKCQECRLKKCKLSGMKEESVLSEEQVKAKRLKRECDTSPFSPSYGLGEDKSIPSLTPQQRSLIELLNANERRFQWPTTEDMKKVTAWVEEDDSTHSRALRFAHFTELCILIVQLVVEFTKQLPGFLTVLREDQIVLLKACAIEVMLLRAAKQYNKHDGTINFLNGKLYNRSSFYRAGMQVEFVDPIFHFCNSMARLDLDETEYAILVAINTFSTDRPHIKDVEKVECMQDPYVELLRVYSKIRHPNDPLMFARILMKIVELRTLNNYHSEQMFALKVQDRKLPPLLAEIWDM